MDAEKLTDTAAAKGYGPSGCRRREDADPPARRHLGSRRAGAGAGPCRLQQRRDPLAACPAAARRPANAAAYEDAIRRSYGELADYYPEALSSSAIGESMLANTRDALYGWTSTRLAIGQTAIGQRGYLYLFDHGYPAADDNGLHAFHAGGTALCVRHGRRDAAYWPKVPDTLAERRLSDAMMGYWVSFATTGDPVAKGQPAWLPYGKDGELHGLRPDARGRARSSSPACSRCTKPRCAAGARRATSHGTGIPA